MRKLNINSTFYRKKELYSSTRLKYRPFVPGDRRVAGSQRKCEFEQGHWKLLNSVSEESKSIKNQALERTTLQSPSMSEILHKARLLFPKLVQE